MLRKTIIKYLQDCFDTTDVKFEVKLDGTAGISVFGATIPEITEALKKIDISVIERKYLRPNNFDVHIFYSNNNKLTEKEKKSLEVFLNAVFKTVDLKDNGTLNATKTFTSNHDFTNQKQMKDFLKEIGFDEVIVTSVTDKQMNILARFNFNDAK